MDLFKSKEEKEKQRLVKQNVEQSGIVMEYIKIVNNKLEQAYKDGRIEKYKDGNTEYFKYEDVWDELTEDEKKAVEYMKEFTKDFFERKKTKIYS